jgi:hypothetical protein
MENIWSLVTRRASVPGNSLCFFELSSLYDLQDKSVLENGCPSLPPILTWRYTHTHTHTHTHTYKWGIRVPFTSKVLPLCVLCPVMHMHCFISQVS